MTRYSKEDLFLRKGNIKHSEKLEGGLIFSYKKYGFAQWM
jgi:hypothetical protein